MCDKSDDLNWVVLAGGLGTRSANPELPKILQEIGKGSLLEYLIDSLESSRAGKVIFVLRLGAEQIEARLIALKPLFDWEIVFDQGKGPVSALKESASFITSDKFGCILGDTAVVAPLQTFKRLFLESGRASAVVVRQTDHSSDSDQLSLDSSSEISEYAPKGMDIDSRSGFAWGISGITFLTKARVAELDSSSTDIAAAIFSKMRFDEILPIRSSFFHRDSGTPSRLEKLRQEVSSGKVAFLKQRALSRPALFVDRDGTLVPDQSQGRSELRARELNISVSSIIKRASDLGIPVFLVSNQPAIAKGFIDFEDLYQVTNTMQKLLLEQVGSNFDDFEFCPHHPERGFPGEVAELKVHCKCRKPDTQMFKSLASRHGLSLAASIMVGDTDADLLAAKNLGMCFIDVNSSNFLTEAEDSLDKVLIDSHSSPF
tara:strand:- start:40 stop:1329 length:1290 start_codon:yes stop_codon:yes gene_type:complete